MPALHPGQFGRLLGELRGGGFSEHLPTGDKPTSGFMVSDYESGEEVPSGQTTEAHLKSYAERKGLTTAPPGEMFGGWPSEGTDYLDRSRKYPTESRGRVAMAFQNQQSMYDASKDPEAPDAFISNPGYEKDYTEAKGIERGAVIPTWLRPSREQAPQIRPARGRS